MDKIIMPDIEEMQILFELTKIDLQAAFSFLTFMQAEMAYILTNGAD